jgi:hypothetical protein
MSRFSCGDRANSVVADRVSSVAWRNACLSAFIPSTNKVSMTDMDEFVGSGSPVSKQGLEEALRTLGSPPENLWAVLATETSGCGFLADKRPKILFERHIFHRLTDGHFDAEDPDVSSPTQGGYGQGGANQYLRLHAAILLNRQAALKSTSWGLGQILGLNFVQAGYDDVETMVKSFVQSEDAQLLGMAAFIGKSGMQKALVSKRWTDFARLYNGPDYARGNYDGNLAQHCAHYKSLGCPDLIIRSCQVLLDYAGFETGGVDGVAGPVSVASAKQYQAKNGLPEDGVLDQTLLDHLLDLT